MKTVIKKIIFVIIYICILVILINLAFYIFLNRNAYYMKFYNMFGKYKYNLNNNDIIEKGINLNIGSQKEDIKEIRINNSEPYGYLVTYKYINSDDKSITIENSSSYIEYVKNNGYDGFKIYTRFFKSILIAILVLILLPLIFIVIKTQKEK